MRLCSRCSNSCSDVCGASTNSKHFASVTVRQSILFPPHSSFLFNFTTTIASLNAKESLRVISYSSWTLSRVCSYWSNLYGKMNHSNSRLQLLQQHYKKWESQVRVQVHKRKKEKSKIHTPTHIILTSWTFTILKTNCEKFVEIMNILHSHYKWHIIRAKLLQNGLLAFSPLFRETLFYYFN